MSSLPRVLINTATHYAIYEDRQLMVGRQVDGHVILFKTTAAVAKEMTSLGTLDPVKGPQMIIDALIRAAGGEKARWHPMFKPKIQHPPQDEYEK